MLKLHQNMTFNLSDKILKVSEFNELFDRLVSYQSVIIEGEISEINVSQNKWLFITLKDQTSQIEVFAVSYSISTLPVLKAGLLVHVYGTPRIHQKSGRFRITADQIIPAGEGELKIAFEMLKLKLEKEGLFAVERKRQIPEYPTNIALLTAENSQAYHDFVKILNERYGGVTINFFPISVQGADAVSSITKAFNQINLYYSKLDLAVLTRGGGSLEDLQAFNNEQVVRAIFSSKIPVVSAIGHEKDITLSDLAADIRASTPSNAAELISPDKKELYKILEFKKKDLENTFEEKTNNLMRSIQIAFSLIDTSSKEVFYKFQSLKDRLKNSLYDQRIILQNKNLIDNLEKLLNTLSIDNTLKRGFSITFHNDKILRDTKSLAKGDIIKSKLYKGDLWAKIIR